MTAIENIRSEVMVEEAVKKTKDKTIENVLYKWFALFF